MSKRSISVEIFRDLETPDVSINDAVAGLADIQQLIEPLKIIDKNRRLKLSKLGSSAIYTNQITSFNIRSDFGIILTERPIIVASGAKDNKLQSGQITVGNTWPNGRSSPFSLIDAQRSYSVKNSTMHELGHLFRVPGSGESYDGDCHCIDDNCVMHPLLAVERSAFCNDCEKQLVKSAANLIEYTTCP